MIWNKFKGFVQKTTWRISPKLSCAISYYHNRHRWPNFNNPKDLSEIVFNQMITGEIRLFVEYVDKIEVRKHIMEWGLGNYLPKLYGVWEHGDEINFEILPEKFALKTNNYNGGHVFCKDKSKLDLSAVRRHMDEGLHSVVREVRESQYSAITPKIFAEELLEEDGLLLPIDYKFHCCDGVVKGCLVVTGRDTETGIRLAFYDLNWVKKNNFVRGNEKYYGDIAKPSNYKEMLNIAEMIAKKFTQVRVDLYNINNKVYIGELTFTPEGGMMSYYTNECLEYLGH